MPKVEKWSGGSVQSVDDPRSLAEAKAEKVADLASARDHDLHAIDVQGQPFSLAHLALFVAEEHTAGGPFLTAGEKADVGAGLAALAAKIAAAKAALAAATTNDEVDAIQW